LVSLGRDEILNGKTLDRNSNYFSRYCFEHGIELYVSPFRSPFRSHHHFQFHPHFASSSHQVLSTTSRAINPKSHLPNASSREPRNDAFCLCRKRIEVIADDEAEIIEASRRMVQNYDFVVTSGGIGPTHDGSCCSPIVPLSHDRK